MVLQKIMEKVFITNKFTQCKTSRTLKIDVSKYHIIKILVHLKYWYYDSPYMELPCLPQHFHQVLPYPIETPLQHKPHHVLHRFPYFVLPHSTTPHHKYWIYQTISHTKPIKFIIKLFTDHNTLWIKHATH